MRLKKFIQKLEKIVKKHGDDVEVIMADNIPATSPIFSRKYPDKKNVILTDKE